MKTEFTILFQMIEHLYLHLADLHDDPQSFKQNRPDVGHALKDRLGEFKCQLIALESERLKTLGKDLIHDQAGGK